ncbi:MAG: lysophospholipid acyltransferase family protein [Nanoarchaeota archaeon]|nr:lysophospholipid acyltransferase family protein [Nanoarchaeota archaeon]
MENLPKGGAILAANHSSYLDHFIIGTHLYRSTGRIAHFLAKKEHFDDPLQRWWHRYLEAIPLDRASGGKEALAQAVKELKKGKLIMMYPEGTRTLTGKMNRGKTGAARLAIAANVPVIPIGITNTFKILPKGKWIPRFGLKADMRVGRPMMFERTDNRKDLRTQTTTLMKEIAKLAKTKYPYED